MSASPEPTSPASLREWLCDRSHLLELAGAVGAGLLYAVALKHFVLPAQVIPTGTEGIAASLGYYFGSEAVFLVLYTVFQAGLLAFAFRAIGLRFALRTLVTVFTVVLGLAFLPEMRFANPESSNERIILVLFGGILAGFAKAIALRLRSSTGDEDIVAAYFAMKYLKPVGSIAVIAAAISMAIGLSLDFAANGSLESVVNTLIYTSIYIFASAETLNNFFRKFKLVSVTILHRDPARIGATIREALHYRTFTICEGRGGYSQDKMGVVQTIVTHEELPELVDAIERDCPDAFFYHHDVEGISRSYYIRPIG